MKKALKIGGGIVAGIIVLAIVGYFGYGWYISYRYGQHLPTVEIDVNGVAREYNLFVPEDPPEGPMSLVVLLNGGSAGSWPFPRQRNWEALGEEAGIVIAVPIGKLVPPNEGAWQLNTDAGSYQDIDYITAMIDEISSNHSLDATRTYAVGYSLGSMFSYELACQMSDRFAAIASFAGTMPLSPKACDPKRNVPLMHIHGAVDPIIAYGNTWDWKEWDSVGTMRDIPGLVQFWRDRYRCQNASTTDAAGEAHVVYDTCDGGARVEHYRLEKRGHGWPETLNGEPTYSVIWSFLSSFTMR